MIDVLVVDDDFMVASIHSAFVDRTTGFRTVGVAHTGREALEKVAYLRPQLVLLDIYLPDMNGVSVLNKLRTNEVDADVLVITAAQDQETVMKALRGGVFGYILKPFDESSLQDKLNEYSKRYHAELPRNPSQSDLDRFFGAPYSERSGSRRPKGITEETESLIVEILNRAGKDVSAAECAELSGLSRVSARRYLEYFASKGDVSVTMSYATSGRPERRYHLLKK